LRKVQQSKIRCEQYLIITLVAFVGELARFIID